MIKEKSNNNLSLFGGIQGAGKVIYLEQEPLDFCFMYLSLSAPGVRN